MLAEEKMKQALEHLYAALHRLEQGEKRLAIGELDYVKDSVLASIHLLVSDIILDEGEF